MAKKTLVAVESPHKAKVIQGFLGPSYRVLPTVGHFRELPEPKALTEAEKKKYGAFSVDMDHGFTPLHKVTKDKAKVVADFRAALRDADEFILATDPDNEGALISLHLLEELKPQVPTYRATWHEITKEAVEEGLQHKQLVDAHARTPKDFFGQAESALTRSIWDRVYGFSTSPYLWRVLKPRTSGGRVQTPAASLVVDRELKRLQFKSVAFYSILGRFGDAVATLTEYKGQKIASGANIDAQGVLAPGYLLITDQNLSSILRDLKQKAYEVGEVKSKPYRRSAPPPFNTSTALQSIGGKTRMGSKQITSYFQQLYAQDSALTYIRTMSVVAAPEAIQAARKSLERDFGSKYLHGTPKVFKDKKEGNSGHECLRPVVAGAFLLKKSFSDPKKQAVFDSVYKRMLASQAIDCTGTTWTGLFKDQEGQAVFSSAATEVHEPGWTKVYGADEPGEEASLAGAALKLKKLTPGEQVVLTGLKKEAHRTQPPARYTEPNLIADLAALGIGRPATFSSMVSVIQDRGYVVKVKNQLVPTFMGFAAVELMRDAFPKFTDYGYTAELEEQLEAIAEGKESREHFLGSFWRGPGGFEATVEGLKNNIDWARVKELSTLDLGNNYAVVFNRHGAWLEDLSKPQDAEGRRPSVRLPDDATVEDLQLTDPEVCKELFAKQEARRQEVALGALSSGAYKGWLVTLREGQYGPYLQGVSPKPAEKPVNMKLPEGIPWEEVTLATAEEVFAEVKLPRTLSEHFFVGVGKRGPWAGRKASAKARRAVFISLDEGMDPRTVSLAEVEALWKRKQDEKKAREASALKKKQASKEASPGKPSATKNTPESKPPRRRPKAQEQE